MSIHQATALKTAIPAPQADQDPATLHSPFRLGDLALRNRLVMAPMTRSRATDGNVPNSLAATYYAQRASAGLIITEATQVSPQGIGYIRTPGIHSAEQVAGWRTVTDAVHRRAERSSRSSGTSAACRIPTFTTARCRLLRPRCRSKAKPSPPAGGRNW
jgi:hypothetical protein